jgi:hypothetical protein
VIVDSDKSGVVYHFIINLKLPLEVIN